MNRIFFWFKVRKQQKYSDALYKQYKEQELKAKKEKKSPQEIYDIGQIYSQESQIYDDEIMDLHTRYLYSKAQKLLLPIPDYNDESLWDTPNFSNRKHLTNKGITLLRSQIRKELHERRAGALTWLAALTGVIGALSGLVAIIGSNF